MCVFLHFIYSPKSSSSTSRVQRLFGVDFRDFDRQTGVIVSPISD